MTQTERRAFMLFLEAEGIVREGFQNGKPGYIVTQKGRGLTKAASAELCWRWARQAVPCEVPLQ
jgi:hypothetical protein